MQFKAPALNCGCKNRHLVRKSNTMRKLKALIIFFFIGSLANQASAQQYSMTTGDSLFVEKKYTEAFEHYKIAFQNDQASQAMLLKMAFIKEGLGDYVNALFYLNKYYLLTADKSVLIKMEELASEKGLSGYRVGDADFFQTALLRFNLELQLLLVAVSLLLLVLTLKADRNHFPLGLPIVQVLVLCCLMIVSNDWLGERRAIIKEHTILMTGPSAAAEPFDQVKKGHKVRILGESDVWVKIQMDDEEAFIRKAKLLQL